MGVHHGQDAQFLAGGELIVNEVHGPDIVRANRYLAVIPELCLHPAFGTLIAQLKT
jgi:hypothetical protein